jgi:hypothetical protein
MDGVIFLIALTKLWGPKTEEGRGERINSITRSFIIRTPHQILLDDKIKKNGMGRVCGTYGKEEVCILGYRWET